jgi:hypothetical protein
VLLCPAEGSGPDGAIKVRESGDRGSEDESLIGLL